MADDLAPAISPTDALTNRSRDVDRWVDEPTAPTGAPIQADKTPMMARDNPDNANPSLWQRAKSLFSK
jgi:hypothetical protein